MQTEPAVEKDAGPDERLTFAVAYASLLAFAFAFQSLPPILRLIMTDLKLNHTEAGLLMGLFALPGILLTIPGGWLTDVYGPRRVGIIAAGLTISGTLVVAGAPDFTWLAIGRLISGVGAMTLVVIAASLISRTFEGRRLGTAMGLYNTGMPIGTIICFTLLGAVGAKWGWRGAVAVSTLAGFAALALLIYRPEGRTKQPPAGIARSLRSAGGPIWLAGLAWLWFNAAVIAFLTFSPDYFQSLGLKASAAAFLASLIMWGALIVSPIIGPFMGGVRRKRSLIIAGAFIPGLIYLALPSTPDWRLPLMVTLGLTAALLPAPLFALPAEIVDRRNQGVAFGILSTCLNAGILLGPFIVGRLRDATGSYRLGFISMAAFSALATLSIIPLTWRRGRAIGAGPLHDDER